MLLWLIVPFFALPLIGMIFLMARRGALISALASKSGEGTTGVLRSLGIDPGAPVRLEFTLLFPACEQATAAATDFPAPQWSTTVAMEATEDGWPCTAITESVVNDAILQALQTLCREIATAHDGHLDGWQVQSASRNTTT